MAFSKLTSKFQATIPKQVREALNVKAGDSIVFELLADGKVVVRKQHPLDLEYTKSLESTLSEWESDIDDEDYKDL